MADDEATAAAEAEIEATPAFDFDGTLSPELRKLAEKPVDPVIVEAERLAQETTKAIEVFQKAKILYGPGKAANAGGVATSGLEMSQNSERLSWTREEVDSKLRNIMISIHETCVKYGKEGKYVNYVKGANIGGFVKVADAMLDQGLV